MIYALFAVALAWYFLSWPWALLVFIVSAAALTRIGGMMVLLFLLLLHNIKTSRRNRKYHSQTKQAKQTKGY